ncbi:2-amino-4-hydroxy-6-hydroxymethyldihydropteridine diphosphokinase [Paracoccus beibuensis]|uniref:2-amino-4-hydroxy-6- hydroxymethyldihydropteridine diphosphokinase n=1 Tax=Paracoccus beibuensis TaxID=547602 RepID=UPI00223F10C5|nr:2-amino-4-hydroxy-6-hydroxymethyldihydropteridine diphosphokinase [Paracoccus beibuensis]
MVKLSFGIVALGANLPLSQRDPRATLRAALNILHSGPGISISALSRFWRTPAVPTGSGPDFVNAAATIRTDLPPDEVLAHLHRIEAEFGRDRSGGRWSARSLDLDLVAMDDRILPNADHLRRWMGLDPQAQRTLAPDRLILPHPRLQDRAFVLAPLAEIAPGWRHPLTGQSVSDMLAALRPEALEGMVPMGTSDLDIRRPSEQ